jgi:hypothetical protein
MWRTNERMFIVITFARCGQNCLAFPVNHDVVNHYLSSDAGLTPVPYWHMVKS